MTDRKPTFKQIQEAAKAQMDRNLMERSRAASQVAKLVRGVTRQRLYTVKTKGLAHLIRKGRAKIAVDHVKCPGLLSIRVRGQGALHTHEGWLKPHLDLRARNDKGAGQ